MSGFNGDSGKFASTHGMSRHPGYRTWIGMVSRCHSPSHVHFSDYGGRGLVVCGSWRSSPVEFLKWLDGAGWSRGMQVDRVDNDGGYSPENCRVVPPIVNAANKRNNRLIDVHGQMMHLAQAARHLDIPIGTLGARLRKGFSGAKLIAPSRPKGRAA